MCPPLRGRRQHERDITLSWWTHGQKLEECCDIICRVSQAHPVQSEVSAAVFEGYHCRQQSCSARKSNSSLRTAPWSCSSPQTTCNNQLKKSTWIVSQQPCTAASCTTVGVEQLRRILVGFASNCHRRLTTLVDHSSHYRVVQMDQLVDGLVAQDAVRWPRSSEADRKDAKCQLTAGHLLRGWSDLRHAHATIVRWLWRS